jgi:predicted AlkP superfamily pyrophosphatase or phosphodiesterase
MGNFIDDEYFCYADTAADAASCENNYVDRAINKIDSGDWNLMVIYFDQVDETGHEEGWCGEKQEKAIGEVNDKIAKVMQALHRNNMMEKTNIFLIADHGGKPGDFAHGK